MVLQTHTYTHTHTHTHTANRLNVCIPNEHALESELGANMARGRWKGVQPGFSVGLSHVLVHNLPPPEAPNTTRTHTHIHIHIHIHTHIHHTHK